MHRRTHLAAAAAMTAMLAGAGPAAAGSGVTVDIHRITADGVGTAVGTVTLRDSKHGLLVIPDLRGLGPPRPHAAHVHENASCAPAEKDDETVPGAAAGGHYDPAGTGAYTGPYKPGALGDLPNLHVAPGGRSTVPVLAPRLTLKDVRGRALMIHAETDRYGPRTAGPDHGDHDHDGQSHGGTRMFCGVIPGGG